MEDENHYDNVNEDYENRDIEKQPAGGMPHTETKKSQLKAHDKASPEVRKRSSKYSKDNKIKGRTSYHKEISEDENSGENSNLKHKSLYPSLENEKSNLQHTSLYPTVPKDFSNLQITQNEALRSPQLIKETSKDSISCCRYLYTFILLLLISFIGLYFYNNNNNNTPLKLISNNEDHNPFQYFIRSLNDLKKQFPGQDNISWKVVNATVKGLLNVSKVERPGVIVLLYEKEAGEITLDLAKQLADNFIKAVKNRSLLGYNIIDPFTNSFKIDKQKLDFDQKVNQSIKEYSTVIIKNIEKFDFEVISILHGFCDDSFAPMKKAFYILTLESNRPLTNITSPKILDNIASSIIKNSWSKTVSDDYIYPLLSRIIVNVAGIRKVT